MRTIGIIGLGLIGGSLAKALKEKMPDTLIIAYNRSSKPLEAALSEGVIDHSTKTINEAFAACDIIFICVPVNETYLVAEKLKKYTSKNTIVTDVGSTKSDICSKMSRFEESFTFIGGHPMAGSEQTGYFSAKHYLFENAYYLLTPYENTPMDKLTALTELVTGIGALPFLMDADSHDYIVGAISHVPHVIAMTLVNAVASSCTDEKSMDATLTLASGGFKDITRIASSSPKMWNDISIQNKDNIFRVLNAFKLSLDKYEELLRNGYEREISALFESAKNFRDEFKAAQRPKSADIISVDIEDKPGSISFVSTVLAYNGVNIKNIGISNSRDSCGILEIMLESSSDKTKSVKLLRDNGLIVHV